MLQKIWKKFLFMFESNAYIVMIIRGVCVRLWNVMLIQCMYSDNSLHKFETNFVRKKGLGLFFSDKFYRVFREK